MGAANSWAEFAAIFRRPGQPIRSMKALRPIKRALATFGKPFGLELYRSSKTASQKPLSSPPFPAVAETRVGFHPDDATPVPRPSQYYARARNPPVAEKVAPPLVPVATDRRIDESVLTIAEPKRFRDKAHLKFVASPGVLLAQEIGFEATQNNYPTKSSAD